MTSVPPGSSPGSSSHGVDADRILGQPLFASLSRQDAEELVRFCEVRHYEPGHPVFTQGGLAAAFFVIESGQAEALADGATLRELGPGDWFGEIGIGQHSPRTATVSATSPLTVIAMTAFEFRRLEVEHPDIAATIERTMQERLGS
jgi:CRP-like cAMP-binding protein